MAAPTMLRSCRLIDLPNELLLQCMPVFPDEFLSSRGACRKLFNLQLAGIGSRSLRLDLKLKLAKDGGGKQARKALERMVESFPSLLKLAVYVYKGVLANAALGMLLEPHPTHGPAWLVNVIDITIRSDAQLDNFIPQCIAGACPQLVRLKLYWSHCKQQNPQPTLGRQGQQQQGVAQGLGQGQGANHHEGQQQQQQQGVAQGQGRNHHEGQQQQDWQPVSLLHLKELVLEHCTFDMQPDAVVQQLQALPSLQDFTLITDNYIASDMFSSKVTNMTWGQGGELLTNVKGPWPKLREFDASSIAIHDDDLEMIMDGMPRLETLLVNDVWLSEPCSQPLPFLSTINVSNILKMSDLKSLRDLALSCACPLAIYTRGLDPTSIDLSYGNVNTSPEEDLATAASVASVLKAAGGLNDEDGDACGIVFISSEEPPHMQQVLHSLLPAFDDLMLLILEGSIHVSTALLSAVGQLPSLKQLWLRDSQGDDIFSTDDNAKCTFEEGIWGSRMIEPLPQLEELSLSCVAASEICVVHLCLHSPRPIKVCVKPVGWQHGPLAQGVLGFMQALGTCTAVLEIM